jgi:flagellar hook assembly protein FlgD
VTQPILRVELYPNPTRGAVTLQYTNPASAPVSVTVLDVRGRRVRTLVDEVRPFGSQTVRWDGRNEAGTTVSSGVYFFDVKTPTHTARGKVVLLP